MARECELDLRASSSTLCIELDGSQRSRTPKAYFVVKNHDHTFSLVVTVTAYFVA